MAVVSSCCRMLY